MTETHHIAVLTGDLVLSALLGPERITRAFGALEACALMQAGWMGASLRFTRHRGDGWQVVLARPRMALRSALTFRAALRAQGDEFDSYISIAEGVAPRDIVADLNSQTGEVFVESGRGLDELKEAKRGRMIHNSFGPVDAATILADRLSQGWTQAQAAAILPTLAPDYDGTHSAIARRLGKSRQAVTKSLQASGQDGLELALGVLERDQR